MSEELWKKEKMQLPSASALLEDYRDEVDVFEVTAEDGIEMLSWGMKKIVQKLDVRVNAVEIALDATCKCHILYSAQLLISVLR
ncbi:hypothetical protein F5880DRAFT_1591792 [Lentinula raphanica]|nr:hypothetical protein F5880DRAFT_1591792 [Lentinula raphanica]